jgi:phenylpyruvate tautomerase
MQSAETRRFFPEGGPLLDSLLGMPLLQIQSSNASRESVPAGLLAQLSAEIARELAKPESYVMVSISPITEMLFGGTSEPACFAALKNIGSFAPEQTERLSALLCRRLSEALGVVPSRIYIEFVEARGHLWGHDGGTFA